MSPRSLISALIAVIFTFSSIFPSQALAATQPAKTEVILIQDAHSDAAAQLGIEKLLRQITSLEKIDFIALEGAWTRLTPEVLEFSRNPETNQQILLHLLKHGEISGADLFAVSHKSKFVFEGVEDKKIYKKYFDILKSVLGQHEKAEAFSKSLRGRLMDQSSRELNPKLRDFIRQQELYIEGNLSPLAYLEILKKLYREGFGTGLTDIENQIEYPNTLRILALKKLIVSKEAEAEYKKFRASAGSGELRGIVEGVWDKEHSFPFSENLKSALRFHILEEELAGAKLFTEIDTISEKLLEKLARTEKEKVFLKEWQDARLFSKLLKLEISPEDWAKIKEKDFYCHEIASLYQQAKTFYLGAELRDQVMAKNLIRLIDSRHAKKAVLITGGFHTESIRKLLTLHGVQTRVITPERGMIEAEGYSQFAGKISLSRYRDSILHTSIALPQIATMPKPDVAQPVQELLDVDAAGVAAIRHRVREAMSAGKSLGIENQEPWLAPWKKLVKDPSLTRDAAKKVVLELLEKTGCRASAESIETYTQMYLDGDTYPGDLEIFFTKRAREQKSNEEQAGKNRWDRRSSGEAATGLSLGTKSKPSLRVKKPAIDPEDLESLPLFQTKEGQKDVGRYSVYQHPELGNELDQLARIIKTSEVVEGMYMIYWAPEDEKFKKSEIGFFLKTRDFPNGTALSITLERKKDGVVLTRGILYKKGAATNRVYSPLTKTKEMLKEKILEEKIRIQMAKAKIGKKLGAKTNGHSLGEAVLSRLIVNADEVAALAREFHLTAEEENIYTMPLHVWNFELIAKQRWTEADLRASFAAQQKIRKLAKETRFVVGDGFGYPTLDGLIFWSNLLKTGNKTLEELREEFTVRAELQGNSIGGSLGTESNGEPITWQNLPETIMKRYGLHAQIFHTFFTHEEQLRKEAIIISREERRVHIDVFDQTASETLDSLDVMLKKMRAPQNGLLSTVHENGSKPNIGLSTQLNDPAQEAPAHSLGATQHTAVEISEGLISPRIAEKSPAAARAFILQLKSNGASPALVAQIETYLSSKTSLDITLKILAAIAKMPEKRPVLNIFTSDQLSEDAIDIIRHLHRFNPQERTIIAVTSRISDRMTAKIAAIHNVHIIKPEQIADRIEAFEKEYPGEDAHKMITVNAPQPILDSLSNYSGVNFITPITENAAFKSAQTRDKIGALLAERSVAHLLAYYRGDTTAFEKIGLGGILTLAKGHTEFAPRYDLNWSAIASSLGKLVDEWRGIEEMERSA